MPNLTLQTQFRKWGLHPTYIL